MQTRGTRSQRGFTGAVSACIALLVLGSCASTPHHHHPTTLLSTEMGELAAALAAASPIVDPADEHARDAAAERLATLQPLSRATGDRILWGGYDPAKGYDPVAYRLTEFVPLVWTKLYLSTFMFTGEHRFFWDGRYMILELSAKFRDQLDPGDYPYPFWHSKPKWLGYVNADALVLVFDGYTIVAAYRKSSATADSLPTSPSANKTWDGQWTWTDASGATQPRVALFSYLLSPNNPHAAALDASYRALEERFRAHACMECHAPDNTPQASTLLLLDYPNQALAARHTLPGMIRGQKMPPRDPRTGAAAGVHDAELREELVRLAQTFEKVADDALNYEATRRK